MYLKPNDRDAFVDWPKIKFTDFIEKYPYWVEKYVECPLCFGHGGWNLKINAYPLHEKENNSENPLSTTNSRLASRDMLLPQETENNTNSTFLANQIHFQIVSMQIY